MSALIIEMCAPRCIDVTILLDKTTSLTRSVAHRPEFTIAVLANLISLHFENLNFKICRKAV